LNDERSLEPIALEHVDGGDMVRDRISDNELDRA
jgi:hypothetical protein